MENQYKEEFRAIFQEHVVRRGGDQLLEWLEKWDIPYDEIMYGKPWPGHKGFYVDDRTVRPDEFLTCSVDELNQICEDSKKASK